MTLNLGDWASPGLTVCGAATEHDVTASQLISNTFTAEASFVGSRLIPGILVRARADVIILELGRHGALPIRFSDGLLLAEVDGNRTHPGLC